MAKKDDRYYDNDEELEENEDRRGGSDAATDDPVTYFMKLIDYLKDALDTGGNVPFTGRRLVDTDICLDIVEDMEKNLPAALQYAMQIRDRRDIILGKAQKEAEKDMLDARDLADSEIKEAKRKADQIVDDAENQAAEIVKEAQMNADAMVSQSTIVENANVMAEKILNEARVRAKRIEEEAASYGGGLLLNVEKELRKAESMVRVRREHLADDDE